MSDVLDDGHALGRIVEAGDVRKVRAACFDEAVARLHSDLLERFQAVRDEAGIDDGDAFDTAFRQFLDGLVGVGLKPFGRAEAGL